MAGFFTRVLGTVLIAAGGGVLLAWLTLNGWTSGEYGPLALAGISVVLGFIVLFRGLAAGAGDAWSEGGGD